MGGRGVWPSVTKVLRLGAKNDNFVLCYFLPVLMLVEHNFKQLVLQLWLRVSQQLCKSNFTVCWLIPGVCPYHNIAASVLSIKKWWHACIVLHMIGIS